MDWIGLGHSGTDKKKVLVGQLGQIRKNTLRTRRTDLKD